MGLDFVSRRIAWVAAALYLVVIASGIFAEIGVRQSLVVTTNAAETARRLLASEDLYRGGIGADLLMTASDVMLTALLYVVLRGYGRTLAIVATALRLVSDALLGSKTILAVAPLMILKDANLTFALGQKGDEALALLFLRLHDNFYGVIMIFAGLNLGAIATLVLQSRDWTSRAVGGLLMLAALSDLLIHGAALVNPSVFLALPDALSVIPLLAEFAFVVWLFIVPIHDRAAMSKT